MYRTGVSSSFYSKYQLCSKIVEEKFRVIIAALEDKLFRYLITVEFIRAAVSTWENIKHSDFNKV